jgi:hypothetical protein
MSDYEWTWADVVEAKRRAAMKQIESIEARKSARQIEESFWEKKLVAKFPELEYRTHETYEALISFKDGEEWCMCKGPTFADYRGVHMLVWHKGAKGKFRKLAECYDCGGIVPFIKQVRLTTSKEAVQ